MLNSDAIRPDDPDAIPISGAQTSPPGIPAHEVQFYSGDEQLYDTVLSFLADGLRAAQPLVVIATERHRRALKTGLAALGFDIEDIEYRRDVAFLDARDTLAAFMEGKVPNRELFYATVGNVLERVMRERTYLVARVCGEMVDLLYRDGNVDGALAVEDLWNELAERYAFSLLCAYSMDGFFTEAHAEVFGRICDRHMHVITSRPV